MLKKMTSVAALSVMALSVAACSGGGKTATTTTSPAVSGATATKAPAGEKKVIKMIGWKQEASNAWITDFNKKFEEKYPEYKIQYDISLPDDPYKQLMAARLNAKDVDIIPDASSFIRGPKDYTPGADKPTWQQRIESGLFVDLTGKDFLKNYKESDIKSATTFNGKVYGVPTGLVSFSGLFYNKDIFAKYNLQVPKTWSEFVKLNDTLKQNGVTPIGMAGKDKWPVKLAVMGLQASILDDQQKFDEGLWKGTSKYTDPKAVEVLDKIKTIMDKYTIEGFMGVDYATLPSLFTSGKVAMVADGTWDSVVYAKAGMKFGYFPIPGNDDAAKNADLAGKYDLTFSIAKGPNTEGALKWLEEFSKQDNYASWVKASGFLPVQDVKVDDPFTNELAPYLKNFKLGWEQVHIDKPNEGEHISNADVHAEFIAPGGPIKTAKELADIQQKEWDSAK